MSNDELKKNDPQQASINKQTSDEIDLRKLFFVIWEGKWIIFSFTTLFAIGSIFYALSVSDEYRSTAILMPASASGSSSISKLTSQFGGLASLAGVNLGSESVNKTTIAIELMKTWGFLEDFILKYSLEAQIIAVDGWDRKKNELVFNEDLYDSKKSIWKSLENSDRHTAEPSSWELYQAITQRIAVSQNIKTGLVTLSADHYSPHVAKWWVDKLIVSINSRMQAIDREEALKSISYLKGQIDKTDIAEMRAIFYQLIEEQTKALMLAEISEEYVFKTLSSAKVAEQKFKPKRAVLVFLGTFLGVIFSLLIVFIKFITFKKNN